MRSSAALLCVASLMIAAMLIEPTQADDAALQKASLRSGTPLSAAELAQLLDAQVWKFDVSLPAGATHVDVGLWLKEKGHDARGFAAGVSGPIHKDSNREMIIAIIPVGGTLNDAEKVRVVISGFGIYAASIADNPLRKVGIGRPETPEDTKDGSFNLIGGYEGSTVSSPVSSADKVISLKIETSSR